MLEYRSRPVPRNVYLGQQHSPRQQRVRIEVCPYTADDRAAVDVMRAHRSHLVALQEAGGGEGVLRLCDHRLTPTATVFVYEFFSSKSLNEIVYDEPMNWANARVLFAEIITILQSLHNKGIFHRYIDPSSILVAGTPPRETRICSVISLDQPPSMSAPLVKIQQHHLSIHRSDVKARHRQRAWTGSPLAGSCDLR